MSFEEDLSACALGEIDAAIRAYRPAAVYALFSGGQDSLVTSSLVARHPAFTAAVHINTGIGIEDTRRFVREACRRERWPLIEKHPPNTTYEELVTKYGFPGPAQHSLMYRRLKERALRSLVQEAKRGRRDRVLLVTGARRHESQRRMRTVTDVVQRNGAQVWVSPILDWTSADVLDYLDQHKLPRSLASQTIHMSGECLCGAFAAPGELEEIEFWFPETAQQIHKLQERVRLAGARRHRWGWGSARTRHATSVPRHLCTSCDLR